MTYHRAQHFKLRIQLSTYRQCHYPLRETSESLFIHVWINEAELCFASGDMKEIPMHYIYLDRDFCICHGAVCTQQTKILNENVGIPCILYGLMRQSFVLPVGI